MEKGINILTTGQTVTVEGAEELIAEWDEGKLTREELTEKLMNLETVLTDVTKVNEEGQFKETKE
ncbi:hypothetical protein [Cyanophage S-TIM5]|uniref:Uncharacterized protein n=1 Tax=Cyanophage S-TIM5 TaxID=1137745 RepID=H6WFV0_9CAUD|nr:hypothetical protein F417_gp137 [Cyanophage S-TIM5]AEZ65675.1 hypothetical protein [Cyanophage S-TIM5]UYE97056.1 hypothetical protein [Cyanophage S-TIM61]